MKFYGRNEELKQLREAKIRSKKHSQMTLVVGRRRIGKTKLILRSVEKTRFLYFFVARKNERLLCAEYQLEILQKLNILIPGKVEKFSEIFEWLLDHSQRQSLTIIIDEFQEFNRINPSVFSELQNIWDRKKSRSRVHLIICGSIYSMMKQIFEDAKEPLFGRADDKIHLKPFNVNVLRKIFYENNPRGNPLDFLAFYIITGGVAKYVELLVDQNKLTRPKMLDLFFRGNSLLLDEGKNILIEEFGKEYANYFSILSLLASSKTSRSEVESVLGKNIGGYIDKLENEYSLIKKIKPVFAKEGSRSQKYLISDNFLSFWFRFVYKYRSAVEIENFYYLIEIVNRDFSTICGHYLEKYFIEKMALTKEYNLIGNYWERNNKNEIDLVAINQKEKRGLIAEVKLNKNKGSIPSLKEKSQGLIVQLPGYSIEYLLLSIEDM